MRKRKTQIRRIPHSDRIVEKEEQLPIDIDDNSLSKYVDISQLIPYGEKNSVARGELFYAGIKNSVFPAVNGERPIVDTIFTKDIIRSSFNAKSKSSVRLLNKIDKVINDYVCETTYIYEEYIERDGLIVPVIQIETVPRYTTFYKFGYKTKSQFEDMNVGEESEDQIYTSHLENLDPDDGGMAFGMNVNCIFNISRDVGEDAIIITERLANKFRFNYMDDVEFFLSPNDQILKNVYGDNHTYKPFPLPGEYIDERGIVCSISKIEKNILCISDDIEKSDETFYVHSGGLIYDVEVYCNRDDIVKQEPYLYELYNAQRIYIQNIVLALNELDDSYFHPNTLYRRNKYRAALTRELRKDKTDLKNRITVKIKIANESPLMVGSKITNRHGAKGVTGQIVPDGTIMAEDGTQIDMMVNASSNINRENIGQMFEKDINGLNVFLRKYLNESDDSIEVKFNNIIKWVDLVNQPILVDALKQFKKGDIVELYKRDDIRVKHDPYGGEMDFRRFIELTRFTMTLYDVKPFTIYYEGKPMSSKHYYGKMFMFLLENGPFYDTSISTDEIITSKGSQAKKGNSKKKHHSKLGTTSAKNSNLSTAIIINSITNKDKNLLGENTSPIHNYMTAIGMEFASIPKEDNDG